MSGNVGILRLSCGVAHKKMKNAKDRYWRGTLEPMQRLIKVIKSGKSDYQKYVVEPAKRLAYMLKK